MSAGEGGAPAPPNPFAYDLWPSGEPYNWDNAARGDHSWDNLDFHVDLGTGRLRKGRIGVDRYPSEAADVIADLDNGVWTHEARTEPGGEYVSSHDLEKLNRTPLSPAILPTFCNPDGTRPYVILGLPFANSSIKSIITHHCFEHVGNMIALMEECYRVLEPNGILRIVTPLFPSRSAIEDPDHKNFIMDGTFDAFCGTPGDTPQNCWLASFSVPYTRARFNLEHKDVTAVVGDVWESAREIRVALKAMK